MRFLSVCEEGQTGRPQTCTLLIIIMKRNMDSGSCFCLCAQKIKIEEDLLSFRAVFTETHRLKLNAVSHQPLQGNNQQE